MVFRWLFGSSESRSSPDAPAAPAAAPAAPAATPAPSAARADSNDLDNDNEYTPDDGPPLGPGDSTPSALEDLSRSLKVPLTAIPTCMVDLRPELKLSTYDMARSQFASNVLALTHNAVRLEMADMWSDILPSLQTRCEDGATNALAQDDADDVREWWSGFARFALTASLVDDFVCTKAFDDIFVGFDKETKHIDKLFRKVQEKNNVYLELAVRKMDRAVSDFEKDFSAKGFTQLGGAWQALASILADIYGESEQLVELIDRWVRTPFEYKDLEKHAAKIFTSKKRWGEDDAKRGEMIVILCRWVGTEELMREWMYRNLTKKELKSIDKWMDDYRDKRLAIIDRFHQKKV